MRTLDATRGKWRAVLPQLGVSKFFLTGRPGPCPACGGRDRFRFTDRHHDGDYFCNQCGSGKGIDLVAKVNGWDYKKAAAEIDRLIGNQFAKATADGDETPEEKRAHDAAKAFFATQPDFHPITDAEILLDESIPFDDAMEMIADRQFRGVGKNEPPKSVRDCALWLRRYQPARLAGWLATQPPEVSRWLDTQGF